MYDVNNINSAYPGYAGNQPYTTPEQIQAAQMQQYQAWLRVEETRAKKEIEAQIALERDRRHEEMRIRQEKRLEESRLRRATMTFKVVLDQGGDFLYFLDGNGVKTKPKKVFPYASCFSASLLTCEKPCISVLRIQFRQDNKEGIVDIRTDDNDLSTKFRRAGVYVDVPRRSRADILEQVKQLLQKNAIRIRLYAHNGWNESNDGFRFVRADEATIKEVEHERS